MEFVAKFVAELVAEFVGVFDGIRSFPSRNPTHFLRNPKKFVAVLGEASAYMCIYGIFWVS